MTVVPMARDVIYVATKPPTMLAIATMVGQRCGLTLEDLRLKTPAHRISHPRQEAIWHMRQVLNEDGSHRFSFPQIARFFGLKDHTTCIHAVGAYERRTFPAEQARAA